MFQCLLHHLHSDHCVTYSETICFFAVLLQWLCYNIFSHTELNIAYRAINTLFNRLQNTQETQAKFQKSRIYKLACRTCNSAYVGQTDRRVRARFKDHHRYVKTNNLKSAYAMHIWNDGHEYGNIQHTLELLKTCEKGQRMNCWEILYIQTLIQRMDQYTAYIYIYIYRTGQQMQMRHYTVHQDRGTT